MRQKKSASILRKFLLFNLAVFSILGLFTIIYLLFISPGILSFTLFLYLLYFFLLRKTVTTDTQAMKWTLFIHSFYSLHLLHHFTSFIYHKTDSGGARGPEAGPGALLAPPDS